MQKRAQAVFIAVFLLMITLPFILFGLFKNKLDTANYENRTLTTLKDIADAPLEKKPSEIDSFLNDNAPFKNQFLTLNAKINYRLFNCVQNNEVLLGKENWLFYKNVGDSKSLDDYQGINAYSDTQLKEFAALLTELDGLLKERGTHFIFVIAPNKEQVYSRYMPSNIPKLSPSKASNIYDYIALNSDVNIIYPLEQLQKQSITQQVYYKYDTHWNNAGALVALNEISDAFKSCTVKTADGEPLCDLANLSALYNTLPEDSYYAISGEPEKTGEKLLMLHDSFADAMKPWLERAYDSTFVHSSFFGELNINADEADVFIYETAERYIDLVPERLKSMIDALKG